MQNEAFAGELASSWTLEAAAATLEKEAALSDEEWELTFRRRFRREYSGPGAERGPNYALTLDKGAPVGEICRTVDLSPWPDVEMSWPSERCMAAFKMNWRVFICSNASLTDNGLVTRILSAELCVLDLPGCALLTDIALEAIAENCPALESLDVLDLSRCNFVEDQALRWIVESARCLRELYLHSCDEITDRGVCALPLAPHLEILDLGHCLQLTNRCAMALSQISTLRDLRMDGMNAFTPEFMRVFFQNCPRQLARLQMKHSKNLGIPSEVEGVALTSFHISRSNSLGALSLRRIGRLRMLVDLSLRACPKVENEVLAETLLSRVVRRGQWRRHFDAHMARLRTEWSAATRIQACVRGWKWRQSHSDVVLALAIKREQRQILHIVEEAVAKSQMLGVSRGAKLEMAMPVPVSGRRLSPLEELTMVLAPARDVLELRKRVMRELTLVLEQRARAKEEEQQYLYRLRRSQFSMNAIIMQRWARNQVLPSLARAAREAERAERSDVELAYFGDVSKAREVRALHCICKIQARMRGYMQRTQPHSLVRMSVQNVPRLLEEVGKAYTAQQSALEQISVFNSLLARCEGNQQHFSDIVTGSAKAKHKFWGNLGASVRLRILVCERFASNYAKRLRYHGKTSALVRAQLQQLRTTEHLAGLVGKYLTQRRGELDRGEHGYAALEDAKVRLLFAQTAPENSLTLERELMDVEGQWLSECSASIERSHSEILSILRAFVVHETTRLTMELTLQRTIMREYRKIADMVRCEWAWRRELLATDLASVQMNDAETRAYLKEQTARLEACVKSSMEENETRTEAFVTMCLQERMQCMTLDKRTVRKLEKDIMQIRREVKYKAWTAIIPANRLKPAELVAVQDQMLAARNRVNNDHAHRAAVDAEDDEGDGDSLANEEDDEHMTDTERMIRDLLDDAVQASRDATDPDLEPRTTGFEGIKELLMTDREREKQRMKAVIMERQRGRLGIAEGIASLKLTVGADEELGMKLLNGKLRQRGLAIWSCVRRDLCECFQLAEPVYLWTRTSTTALHHIRGLRLDCEVDPRLGPRLGLDDNNSDDNGSDDDDEDDDSSEGVSASEDDEQSGAQDGGRENEDNESGEDVWAGRRRRASLALAKASRRVSTRATQAAQRATGHSDMNKLSKALGRLTAASKGAQSRVPQQDAVYNAKIPTFAILVSREGTPGESIVDVRVAIGDADAETLENRGYECLDGEMGVPEKKRERVREPFRLWVARSETYMAPSAVDLGKLYERKAEFQAMFEQNPGNKRVAQILHELEQEIKEVEFNREGEDDEALALHKLEQTISGVCMSKKDTRKLMSCFSAMDTDHQGEVTLGQFMYYIGCEENALSRRIFKFLDVSGDGRMDFRELLHALATMCMFGPRELVNLMFKFADTEGKGEVLLDDLKRVMVLQHQLDPVDHFDLKRIVQHIERIYGNTTRMNFDQVYEVHVKYPMMFQPAFEIKIAMCKTFLGEAYWDRKRELFAEVRAELRKKNDREKTKLKRQKLQELRRQQGIRTTRDRIQSKFYDAFDRLTS
ncbi:F-box/LRR-repeat protein 20 [Hondaea fermentalgiana]|uniref:F-box/LRR-repeat protein 20 n=1 Tax=Hondaea fermentalgiana TaxID=2315210 RepID=A0A2R5GK51_9STRA|nr:F-box/LRR-repeat protein 20 [Hondaea fermentalgiana]|eukprot:GBG31005.1 F-box/LRR-repeat protein 20 [Hondaea fermentalgiana]